MNSVITSAKSKIYTSAYPYAEKVNPILHEWIMKAAIHGIREQERLLVGALKNVMSIIHLINLN